MKHVERQNVRKTLAALGRMTPAQLREKYLEVFGEPSRSGNKDFLAKRIAWRVQSLAEGGLGRVAHPPDFHARFQPQPNPQAHPTPRFTPRDTSEAWKRSPS